MKKGVKVEDCTKTSSAKSIKDWVEGLASEATSTSESSTTATMQGKQGQVSDAPPSRSEQQQVDIPLKLNLKGLVVQRIGDVWREQPMLVLGITFAAGFLQGVFFTACFMLREKRRS